MCYIKNLATEFIHPGDVELAMRKHQISQTKLQNKTLTRNELNKIKFTGTNEVMFAARNLVKQMKNNVDENKFKIIEYVMDLKLKDAQVEVDKTRKAADKNKKKLDKLARVVTIARKEFDKNLQIDLQEIWNHK